MSKKSKNKNLITFICLLALLVIVLAAASLIYRANEGEAENGFVNNADEIKSEATQDDTSETIPSDIELAPDFTVFDGEGNKVKLSDHIGKPVVVNFWATWCGFCVEEMPAFENAYKKYKDDVVFMMINASESEEVSLAFVREKGYTFPLYYDKSLSATYAYGVSGIPFTLVIDKYGSVYGYQSGMLSQEVLNSVLETVVKGE